MSTCKDCLHYEVCDRFTAPNETYPEVGGCKMFKPKADYVEVVRCRDCKNYVAEYCTRDIKGRTNMFYMQPTDFCSYGERKGGAE